MAGADEDNIPAATGSPDASLTQDDSFTATSHAGLTYPWGDGAPATGEAIRIAPGISWARIPMPGSLDNSPKPSRICQSDWTSTLPTKRSMRELAIDSLAG